MPALPRSDVADSRSALMANTLLIAGGGIGGHATALTLHQIGVLCVVFEAVRDMPSLGVG